MLAMQVMAAVPVEESVGQQRGATRATINATTEAVQPPPAPQQSPPLNIPPTIESTKNTDFPATQEPTTSRQSNTRQSNTSSQASDGRQLAELFYQMQVLQQELQQLRGQIEEQDFRVRRLQRDQTDKYADVDRRLSGLTGLVPLPGTNTADSTAPARPNSPPSGGFSSEREAYTFAFEEMRARRFDESIAGFQQLIVEYPNGQYTPNAFYWLGELWLAKTDIEQARQSFMQVINLYPDHQKVPDALYKLGVVYDNLGDQRTSQLYLSRVQSDHPKSSAASLAAKYSQEL